MCSVRIHYMHIIKWSCTHSGVLYCPIVRWGDGDGSVLYTSGVTTVWGGDGCGSVSYTVV